MNAGVQRVILVTGASGFIGRYFLDEAREAYRIIAVARRSQKEARVPPHENITWHQVDIGRAAAVRALAEKVEREVERVDFILHLAGFYDFTNEESPEYEHTNVEGTRLVLELAKRLEVGRLVFASSITVTDFTRSDAPLTERSPADATFPYAVSKRRGEELLRDYSTDVPCTVIRLAAVFSDWCEYGPLYVMLSGWFLGGPASAILGGRGESAIPYIHVTDVVRYFMRVFDVSASLRRYDILLASPHLESASHRDLFDLSTRLYFGRRKRPILVPKLIAAIGIAVRQILGRLVGRVPFERTWMIKYIDRVMETDTTHTRDTIPVRPRPRLSILRRLVFMVENLKSYPVEWHGKNAVALQRSSERPSLVLAETMFLRKDWIVARIVEHLRDPALVSRFPSYNVMNADQLRWYVEFLCQLVISSVRTADRMSVLDYARYLASLRRQQGIALSELRDALHDTADIIIAELQRDAAFAELELLLNDSIRLTLSLAADEAEATYETMRPTVWAHVPPDPMPPDMSGRFLPAPPHRL